MTPRPRLVIALAVASLLSVFLLYTAFAGSSELYVSVGQLQSNARQGETVSLTGQVVSHSAVESRPLRMVLRDAKQRADTIPVRYVGAVPDAFRTGRQVVVRGR